MQSRLTLIGLYNYDDTLFQNLSLPEGINEDTAINTILMNCGELSLLYPNLSFMESAIGTWSLKWYHSIERIYESLTNDYEPLYNYDRYENWTDNTTHSQTESETINATGSTSNSGTNGNTNTIDITTTDDGSINETNTNSESGTSSTTTENTVSAYNSDTYQPNDKQTIAGTTTNSISGGSDTDSQNTNTRTGTIVDSGSSTNTGSSTNDSTRTHSDSISDENTKTGRAYGNIGVTTSQQMLQSEIDLRKANNIYDIIAELFIREFCVMVY